MISQKPDQQLTDKTTNVVNLTLTPRRSVKTVKDLADTPVPGSINGSSINKDTVQSDQRKNRAQDKQTVSIDNDQIIRLMKTMETVLERVLL